MLHAFTGPNKWDVQRFVKDPSHSGKRGRGRSKANDNKTKKMKGKSRGKSKRAIDDDDDVDDDDDSYGSMKVASAADDSNDASLKVALVPGQPCSSRDVVPRVSALSSHAGMPPPKNSSLKPKKNDNALSRLPSSDSFGSSSTVQIEGPKASGRKSKGSYLGGSQPTAMWWVVFL